MDVPTKKRVLGRLTFQEQALSALGVESSSRTILLGGNQQWILILCEHLTINTIVEKSLLFFVFTSSKNLAPFLPGFI